MQLFLDIEQNEPDLRIIHQRLKSHFQGFPPRYVYMDPVSQLVMSLLGVRTKGHISRQAHAAIIRQFRGWSEVRDEPLDQLLDLIQEVTFASKKAEQIQIVLGQITGTSGQPSLDHLTNMSVEDGHQWLEALPGVGPKIAAAVLNTSTLRKQTLVIDTHHKRILERLGLLKFNIDFDNAFAQIIPKLPAEWYARELDLHHIWFKRLGQTHCRPQQPDCETCPILKECPYGQNQVRAGFTAKPETVMG